MAETFPIPLGPYQLIERLAVGGMAELFRACVAEEPSGALKPLGGGSGQSPDSPLGRDFVGDLSASLAASLSDFLAIKRLLPHLAMDPYYRTMFLDEAKLTARLTHPNIIRTYDYGDHGGLPFMVMELVDGLDGLSILRECAHRQVRLPIELAVFAAHEVLAALDFAHAQVDDQGRPLGVVHRDISPANVLFGRDGAIKLADFGVAHANQHEQRTKDGTLKGKYGYMSPEQIIGTPVDARSDVFSAGVLLAEMMMGRRLFAAPSELDVLLMVRDVRLDRLHRYGEHIGADLQRILGTALQRDPDERFPTAARFREALAGWLGMYSHQVGSADIRELIALFYDDAWARKRERTARQAAQLAEVVSDLAGVPQALPRESSGPLPRGSAPFIMPRVTAQTSVPTSTQTSVQTTVQTTVQTSVQPEQAPVGVPVAVSESQPQERTAAPAEPGPVSGAVRDEATDGRATRDSLVLPEIDFDDDILGEVGDGRGDQRPGAAPEMSEGQAVGYEASGEIGVPEGLPDESGDFASVSAIELFFRLATERATGLLVARQGPVCKEIYLRRGVPEHVASNVQSDLFGEYLVRSGVIAEDELSMALATQPRRGGRIGDTLVDLGLLQPLDVFRYLSQQLREKVVDVCAWTSGDYELYLGRENLRPKFPLALNPFEIIGGSVRLLGADILFAWADGLAMRRPAARGELAISPELFGLGRGVRRVLTELNGSLTVAELRANHGLSNREEAWVRIFYLLVYTRLVAL